MSRGYLFVIGGVAAIMVSCSRTRDQDQPPSVERVLQEAESVFGRGFQKLRQNTYPGTELQILMEYWYARQPMRRLVIGEWHIRVQRASESVLDRDVVLGQGHAAHGIVIVGFSETRRESHTDFVRDPLLLIASRSTPLTE